MSAGLTKRQAEVLAFIRCFIAANGYSPSFREICAGALDGKSTENAHRIVHALRDRGAITFLEGKRRSISVLDQVA